MGYFSAAILGYFIDFYGNRMSWRALEKVDQYLAKVGVRGFRSLRPLQHFSREISFLERSFGAVFTSPDPSTKTGEARWKQQKAQEVAAIRLPSACMRSPDPGFPPAQDNSDENGRVPVRRFTLGVTGLPQRPK